MPSTSSRRRLTFTLTVGALVSISALAMPTAATAATAAEVCVDTTTVTAATQPWLVLSQGTNYYLDIEAAYAAVPAQLNTLLATVDADFTQTEYNTLSTSIASVLSTAGAVTATVGPLIDAQGTTLRAALLAIDPASGPATDAIFAAWEAEVDASQYGAPLNNQFNATLAAVSAYLQTVQAAITAATPVPVVSASTTTAVNAMGPAVAGFGDFAGDVFYGGAAELVAYEQTCTAALAATGSDPGPATIGAGVLLLLGAGILTIASKRREQHGA